jgi:NAD(P)H dehydrogenase (quinone)
MIAVTGSTGQLGRLVVEKLLSRIDARQIVALARDLTKAQDFAAKGVHVREADYTSMTSLDRAFAGVDTVLLISSNEIGQRYEQHRNVINAAKAAGVGRLIYTSLLHADSSPLSLAQEHVQTEYALKESGIPYVILRNGWYTENYTAFISSALANGAFVGSAKDGRISSASRRDFAEAVVAVLLNDSIVNRTYELAGDEAYTLTELAAEVSRQAGHEIPYVDMPEADYAALLAKVGLPAAFAAAVASWDAGASAGALFDASHQLNKLIGHPTTSLRDAVAEALQR